MSRATFEYAKREILSIMKTADPPMRQLISEDKLCEQLDVSRGTLREILRSLEAEGFISKRHGEGNFVHNSVLNTSIRINQVQDFHRMIEDAGYVSSFFIQKVETVPCKDEDLPEWLEIAYGEPVVRVDGLYTASGTPAIYCKLAFPVDVFTNKLPDYNAAPNIGKMFAKHSKYGIEQTLVHIHAANCDAEMAEVLQLECGKAVVHWRETFYSYTDEVIGVSNSYFNDAIVSPSMILKNW